MKLSASAKSRLKSKYGPWAIVTGASSGIGMEIARQLSGCGIHLLLNGRNAAALDKLKQELSSSSVQIQVIVSDLSQKEGIEALIEASKSLEIGLLVHSAGFGTSGNFIASNLEEDVNMIRVNCESTLILTHHFSKVFVRQKRGGIILMSSIVAFQGVPYASNYAATKAYVQSLAEALALELKPHGVDVLAAAPAPVMSGFGTRANMKMDLYMTPQQVGVPILKALGKRSTVLPGFLSFFLINSLRLLPRWGKIRVLQLVMGGMTKHQRG